MQLYVFLDKLYAGSLQVRLLEQDTVLITKKLPNIGKNSAALQSRSLSMLLLYVFNHWAMERVLIKVPQKDSFFMKTLDFLGFQRVLNDEQDVLSYDKESLLYLLKREQFKPAIKFDGQTL